MSGISKRVAVSLKTKLKALERLKKEPNYGCWIRREWANYKRFRGGKNLKNSEGCCIQMALQRSLVCSLLQDPKGKFQMMTWEKCLCRKDNIEVQTGITHHNLGSTSNGKQCHRYGFQFSLVQFSCSVMSNSMTPWTAAHQTSLPITTSHSLLKLLSIMSVMPSNHLILCHPLLLPSVFPNIRVFSNE